MRITNGRREVSYSHQPPRTSCLDQLEALNLTRGTPDGLSWVEINELSSARRLGPRGRFERNTTYTCEECGVTFTATVWMKARFCSTKHQQRNGHRRRKEARRAAGDRLLSV